MFHKTKFLGLLCKVPFLDALFLGQARTKNTQIGKEAATHELTRLSTYVLGRLLKSRTQ